MKTSGPGSYPLATVLLAVAILSAATSAQTVVKKEEKPWNAPSGASRNRNPLPADEKTITAGKQLFTTNCVACHGALGNGDGPAAGALDRHPGILSNPKMWSESDGGLFWKITNGNTPMPYFRDILTTDQRWQVIHYIRTLAPKPTDNATTANATNTPSGKMVALDKMTIKDADHLNQEADNSKALGQNNSDSMAKELKDIREAVNDLDQELFNVKKMAKESNPGTTKMLIGGYGTAKFEGDKVSGGKRQNAFGAAFNPLLLWKISDRILFEGEIELQLEGSESTVNLEVAQVSYLLNDYMTLGAGRFLIPMNFFVERQHMGWVNRFADKPLAVYDGLLPESQLGLQLRGGIPAGPVKFEYSLYLVNPPTLNMEDSLAYGTLEFDDLSNKNNNMATGGRIGFMPVPHFEIGYGLQNSDVGPQATNIKALLQSVDVNAICESRSIEGQLNIRGQWVWQHVDNVMYDADSAFGFGPKTFNNRRNGGYASLSYRPEYLKNEYLQKLEAGIRFDMLNQKETSVGYDELRYAFALDYWIYQNVVIKTEYEIDRKNASEANGNAFKAEFITGF